MITITIEDNETFGKVCVVKERKMPVLDSGLCDIEDIKKEIDAELTDVVSIDGNIDMIVDDEGLYRHTREPNWTATALRTLYWAKNSDKIAMPCHYPPICGGVALVSYDENGNFIDLNDEQRERIASLVMTEEQAKGETK